jgi:hypothetical protein
MGAESRIELPGLDLDRARCLLASAVPGAGTELSARVDTNAPDFDPLAPTPFSPDHVIWVWNHLCITVPAKAISDDFPLAETVLSRVFPLRVGSYSAMARIGLLSRLAPDLRTAAAGWFASALRAVRRSTRPRLKRCACSMLKRRRSAAFVQQDARPALPLPTNPPNLRRAKGVRSPCRHTPEWSCRLTVSRIGRSVDRRVTRLVAA